MKRADATSSRSRLLLALDRMIESAEEDARQSDLDPATVAELNGELGGLRAARTYAELDDVRGKYRDQLSPVNEFLDDKRDRTEIMMDLVAARKKIFDLETRLSEIGRKPRPPILGGKWTPARCLHLASAEEIDALCALLNALPTEIINPPKPA